MKNTSLDPRRKGAEHDVAGAKSLDAPLIKSDAGFGTLLDQAPASLFLCDEDGRIVDASRVAWQTYGYSQEQLLGMNFEDIDPTFIQRVKADAFAGDLEKKQPIDLEARHRRKDGSVFPVRTSVSWVVSEGKRHLFILALDMTESQKDQDRLRDSENLFRTVFEQAAVGIARVSLDFRIEGANDAYCGMLGYREEELIGKHLKDITHSEVLEENLLKQTRLKNAEIDHYRMEKRFIHKDGSTIVGILDANLVRDSHGVPVYFIGSVVDITDRKLAEKALKKSEKELKNTLDATTDGIWTWDILTGRLFFSPKYYTMLGYEPDEFPASFENWLDLVHPDDRQSAVSESEAYLKTLSHEYENEFRLKTKQGGYRWIRARARAVERDEHGNATYIIGNHEDITERKMLEERLRQAQKMESIGNLAGGIAHDFNNLLSPIIGLSEMLLEDLSEGSLEYENAEEIMNAGMRGAGLVKQILAFSRQSEHSMMPLRIQQVLEDVFKLSRSTIPSNIPIVQNLQPDCGPVMADPTQIHQVAMNLVTNAYHAVEKTGGMIAISLKQAEIGSDELVDPSCEPGEYAVLSVSDTGCGIDPSIMDKIFDPYFTTKKMGKGTGLGLAVVYGIVKEHKGDIKVRSIPGKGTTFDICLPLLRSTAESAATGDADAMQGGRERILLIDDDTAIAKMGKKILERYGYRVTARFGSLEGLETFRSAPDACDLVVTDMAMPNMTGEQLAREIISIRKDIPIIICTGFSERMDRQKAKAIGVKALLMKPVPKSELVQAVRNVLDEANNQLDD